ncbi:MAG TPA: FAD-dependent oxidoreductase [Kofleriaceae bacterium]|jgi:2-polyprenyl-6-methoxyphenol hydroxylase-like FAD-dependent oxidoreductase
MQATTEVLIVGAGASGLVLAVDLARRGVAARVIEQRETPFPGSRGKGIQPRTLEIFEDLGIVDRIAAAGGPYPVERTYHADGTTTDANQFEGAAPTAAEPYRAPLMVPQFATERVLRERLAEFGRAVEFGTALTSFAQDADGVTAQLSTGESVRARFLVGADGGKSTVRHALGIGFPGKTLGVRAIVADVELEGISRDAWHRFHEGDMAHQLALCPLAGTDLMQIQAPIAPEGDFDVSAAALTAFVRERSGLPLTVTRVPWGSAYQMNARLADAYRRGRVFLVGDAAHIHPPTGGQGLNTSVQDAYNLGWKLAARAPDALLDSYEAERRPLAAEMLGLTTRLLDAAKHGDRRRGREVHQLDLGYADSPIALGDRAGDRAPDAPIRGAAGQPRRLFDLFAGPHWTLLGARPAPPRANLHVHVLGRDVLDDGGHVRDAYGLADDEWVLVRPDGYIGAVVRDLAALERYAARVGL